VNTGVSTNRMRRYYTPMAYSQTNKRGSSVFVGITRHFSRGGPLSRRRRRLQMFVRLLVTEAKDL
jgi:hypothetical protein